MKASSIVRICLWTLVALILIGILVTGLICNGFEFSRWSLGWINYRFDEAHTYSIGDTTMDIGTINSLDVEWISGSIRIAATDEEQITVRETVTTNPDNALRWRVRNGELQIRYCKPRFFSIFKFKKEWEKDLVILIPRTMLSHTTELKDISIENVSSKITLEDMNVHNIDIDSVSGDITIINATIDLLDLQNVSGTVHIQDSQLKAVDLSTVSGNLTIDGSVQYLDVSGVSARLNIISDECPQEVSVESVSGSIYLTIPADSGFRLTLDSVSSNLHAPDFQMTSSGNKNYLCGDGNARFDIDTVSGTVNIQKIDQKNH